MEFYTREMSPKEIIQRFEKTNNLKELEKNIANFGRDKCITILMLSGKKHCDAGHLVNQHKRLFQ